MEWSGKIFMQTPLSELWNDSGLISSQRNGYLTKEEIKDMLKHGPVQFIVADVGLPLEWIKLSDCYNFWKTSVVNNLPEDDKKIILDNFPGEYAFIASEWTSDQHAPIIVLEKIH